MRAAFVVQRYGLGDQRRGGAPLPLGRRAPEEIRRGRSANHEGPPTTSPGRTIYDRDEETVNGNPGEKVPRDHVRNPERSAASRKASSTGSTPRRMS